ncbi:probable G-protein coupled receptor 34 [Mugil cephalus]|uniref:probable G-protein coupled receptor 34 n=1 Tax=Mugil cephalus TaxID=48193 RepID=UPI001FB5FCB5|nr:probable G-protein coupled receptor 34 [Mugil cephalus]XP_047432120.1 probable G-protein coupled receptor 34 [Mugil cephalus]
MTTYSSASSVTSTLSAAASFNSSLSNSTSFLSTPMVSFLSATSPPPWSSAVSGRHVNCSLDNTALHVPLAIFYCFFFIFGCVGNLFALWVFLFLHSKHNSVRVLLINCAFADLVLLACLPFRVYYHVHGKWTLGSVACKVVGNLFYMNMYISILLLGLISLDRHLRLKGKGRARRGLRLRLCGHSKACTWVGCAAIWGLSFMALVPMIVTAEDKEDNDQCFQYKHRIVAQGKAYFNAVLVVLFWLVFVVLIMSYAKIACQLLKASRDKPDLPNAHRYERTAKKSFFVLFLFTICFGPYHTFRPIYIYTQLTETVSCEFRHVVDHTNEVMLLFSAFNSCLDPVMYFLLSGSVRKTAVRALGHTFAHRFPFFNEATSNSSTTEYRRPSVPFPDSALNTPSVTPRTSVCIMNSNLRRISTPNGKK